ncbi:hypothetical protein [uncultured Roseibium sp.]|uniref:hypothetical protein n=1 Tax=uncultured Roseibium sp. TaxID=1936171 RepID=UPI00259A0475|nr:hypothetical protein [uncultured Roseibium sp.]
MYARTLLFAGCLLLTGIGAIHAADFVTAKIASWNPASRTLVLDDRTEFHDIPAEIALPDNLSIGQTVTINYIGSEDGIQEILSVEVQP